MQSNQGLNHVVQHLYTQAAKAKISGSYLSKCSRTAAADTGGFGNPTNITSNRG